MIDIGNATHPAFEFWTIIETKGSEKHIPERVF